MNINEFKQKHSDLIISFEETTGRNAIWHNEITNPFIEHLQQNNIKINYKPLKTLIPKRYNYIHHISEFWLRFLKEHTYFSKKQATEDYICEYYSPKNKCDNIKKDFNNIIRHFLKYGIVEHHSRDTYKINKEMVSQYSKNY